MYDYLGLITEWRCWLVLGLRVDVLSIAETLKIWDAWDSQQLSPSTSGKRCPSNYFRKSSILLIPQASAIRILALAANWEQNVLLGAEPVRRYCLTAGLFFQPRGYWHDSRGFSQSRSKSNGGVIPSWNVNRGTSLPWQCGAQLRSFENSMFSQESWIEWATSYVLKCL